MRHDLHLPTRITTSLPVLCAAGWGVKFKNTVEEMSIRKRQKTKPKITIKPHPFIDLIIWRNV